MKAQVSTAVSISSRTNWIVSGEEQLPSFQFNLKSTNIEEIFEKQVSEACYDLSELSLASYLIGLDRGDQRLTAIPVFLSRSFRHNTLYVRADSPWKHPSELKRLRIGLPEYQMTAAVWIRAYFRHLWDVKTEEIDWVTFRPERIPIDTPATAAKTANIFDALVEGEVDAIMTVRRPPEHYFPLDGEGGKIRRLFPDAWEEEKRYYRETNVFPIMHLVSLKKETVKAYPALPQQLYQRFLAQKNEVMKSTFETISNQSIVPWVWESAERSAALMKNDLWPYGLQKNWPQIAQFIEFLKEDGLISRTFTKEEMFHESVLTT
ncbi:4,5-dihydroxyphthalate decarboxylase [Halalkalibacter oceani]|uniref:4,5-dihydroxyphthalate decarboxylase n=1 Tax=Halalkalibacter oceani TaxID=1653776 RepID=UPI0033984A83